MRINGCIVISVVVVVGMAAGTMCRWCVSEHIIYITSYYTLISKRLVKLKSFRKLPEGLDSLTSRVQAGLFLL